MCRTHVCHSLPDIVSESPPPAAFSMPNRGGRFQKMLQKPVLTLQEFESACCGGSPTTGYRSFYGFAMVFHYPKSGRRNGGLNWPPEPLRKRNPVQWQKRHLTSNLQRVLRHFFFLCRGLGQMGVTAQNTFDGVRPYTHLVCKVPIAV